VTPLDRWLVRIEKAGIVLALSVMVGLSFLQVILRLFFSTSLLWADTFLRHLVLWAGLLGACVAASQGGHFAIDVLKKVLPGRLLRPLSALTNALAAAILFVLSRSAWSYFLDDLQTGSVLFSLGTLQVPSAWMTVIIPAGFILLAVHFTLRISSKEP